MNSRTDRSVDYSRQREEMVRRDIAGRGVRQPEVLSAFRKVPREAFVPDSQKRDTYRDGPLPIGSGQTISQPYIVAYMTELLELKGSERVLELGTGSGYQAAILAEIAGTVYSIEVIPPLFERVKGVLIDGLGYSNIILKMGDGRKGWPEEAPFDRIILTAAPVSVPHVLFDQLKTGGILIAPVGRFIQKMMRYKKTGDRRIEKSELIGVTFVPLV